MSTGVGKVDLRRRVAVTGSSEQRLSAVSFEVVLGIARVVGDGILIVVGVKPRLDLHTPRSGQVGRGQCAARSSRKDAKRSSDPHAVALNRK